MDNQPPKKTSDKRPEPKKEGNTANAGGGKPTKKAQKSAAKSRKRKIDTAIVVALIGVAGTTVAALLSSPLLVNLAEPTATSTISATHTESATATEYLTATPIVLVVTSTEVPVTPPTSTFTPILENTVTASSSPEPKADNMTAALQSTVDEGKAPLRVNFDARSSYVKFADGSLVPCGNNPFCSYVFAVYRNSKLVEKVSDAGGVLSYAFGSKGTYFVTVYVCRGNACNDDGVTVTVK